MKDFTGPVPKEGKRPKKGPALRARPSDPLADWCEARLEGCTGRAEVRHHRKLRSQGGGDEAANTADICSADHLVIHSRVAWAKEQGWIL